MFSASKYLPFNFSENIILESNTSRSLPTKQFLQSSTTFPFPFPLHPSCESSKQTQFNVREKEGWGKIDVESSRRGSEGGALRGTRSREPNGNDVVFS